MRNMVLYLFSNAFLLSKKDEVLFYFTKYFVLHRPTVLIFSMKSQISYEESDY